MASSNKLALWVNDRKNAANQPDYKGKFELSWELLQEANAAFNFGQYETDYSGQPCIKLDVALYAQQVNPGDKKPILSGSVSTVTQTQNSALARQQAAQGYAQAPQQQAPQQSQYAQPQQPQAAPQGWPSHVPCPPELAHLLQGQAQPQQPQQPQPVYQQQAPQAYAQPPAQGQAPMPVAPPAPVQPMPGAIHGQATAGLMPSQHLPPGF